MGYKGHNASKTTGGGNWESGILTLNRERQRPASSSSSLGPWSCNSSHRTARLFQAWHRKFKNRGSSDSSSQKKAFFFLDGCVWGGGGILCFSGEIISERLLPGDGLKSHRLCYLYMQVFFREHQRFSSFSSAARTCKREMTHRWYARHLLSNDIIIRQWYWGISLLMHHLIVRIYIGGMLSAACNQWQLIVNH